MLLRNCFVMESVRLGLSYLWDVSNMVWLVKQRWKDRYLAMDFFWTFTCELWDIDMFGHHVCLGFMVQTSKCSIIVSHWCSKKFLLAEEVENLIWVVCFFFLSFFLLYFVSLEKPNFYLVFFLPPSRKPTTVEEILTIDIKPGWKKGTKITFPEKGNEHRNVIPSDLVFIIDEKPHSVFKRDGNDLVTTQKISLVEALTGCTVQLTTLDDRSLSIPINTIISPSHEEVVRGEGMPIPKEPSKKGNLRIKFNIKFPAKLTSEQKTGIKRLLPSSWVLTDTYFV